MDGVIAHGEPPSPVNALIGYAGAVKRLGVFRDSLSNVRGRHAVPTFSVVLIGTTLWTRFETSQTDVTMSVHAAWPSTGDVVVVH